MSDAFAMAAAALAADANIARDATWQPKDGGSPAAVRVLRAGGDSVRTLGLAQAVNADAILNVPQEDLAKPVEGDTVTIGAEVLTITAVTQDSAAAFWVCYARRAAATNTARAALRGGLA